MSDGLSDAMKPSFWEKTLSLTCFNDDLELQRLLFKLQNKENKKNKLNVMKRLLILYGTEQHYAPMFEEDWRFPSNWELFELIQIEFKRNETIDLIINN
jgi:hypothetical protein